MLANTDLASRVTRKYDLFLPTSSVKTLIIVAGLLCNLSQVCWLPQACLFCLAICGSNKSGLDENNMFSASQNDNDTDKQVN